MIASRVMSARWHGFCCLCGCPYFRGSRIGLLDLGEGRYGWAELACILATQRAESKAAS